MSLSLNVGERVLFRKVDCVLLRVPKLDEALAFYRDKLGHELVWRKGSDSAGLRMREVDTEVVLVAESGGMEVDLLVDSVDTAVVDFERAGGRIVEPPFDIAIGRCAVVRDPWENTLVILDMSKGPLKTDRAGNVLDTAHDSQEG